MKDDFKKSKKDTTIALFLNLLDTKKPSIWNELHNLKVQYFFVRTYENLLENASQVIKKDSLKTRELTQQLLKNNEHIYFFTPQHSGDFKINIKNLIDYTDYNVNIESNNPSSLFNKFEYISNRTLDEKLNFKENETYTIKIKALDNDFPYTLKINQ
jgi:hypothetical protein